MNFMRLRLRALCERYVGVNPTGLDEMWRERAAVREYDGGMTKREAEEAALADVRRWVAERHEPREQRD